MVGSVPIILYYRRLSARAGQTIPFETMPPFQVAFASSLWVVLSALTSSVLASIQSHYDWMNRKGLPYPFRTSIFNGSTESRIAPGKRRH